MGLVNMRHVDEVLASRKAQSQRYDERLDGAKLRRPQIGVPCEYNHAYYPIILDSEAQLHKVVTALLEVDVIPRRYFYPSLSSLSYINPQVTPVSDDVACRVLALPVFFGLKNQEIDMIAEVVARECAPARTHLPAAPPAPPLAAHPARLRRQPRHTEVPAGQQETG
jgi:dTDP-4-amino-4,6-dideoxygalactose transaminase